VTGDAFFFYGTLMDREVLSKVLGRRVWPRERVPALSRGYRHHASRGEKTPLPFGSRREQDVA
jgi:hypothetical protein